MLREDVQRIVILVLGICITLHLLIAGDRFFHDPPRWWPFEVNPTSRTKALDHHLLEEAHQISSKFKERELAHLFLTNSGRLPAELRTELQTTGLLHLIAISAGQLLPVLGFSDKIMCRILLLKNSLSISALSSLRLGAGFLLTSALSLLYGLTGSLVRVLLSLYANRFLAQIACAVTSIKIRNKKNSPVSHHRKYIVLDFIFETLLRDTNFAAIALVGLFGLLGRNLLTDWSFLYASIGAHSCAFGIMLTQHCKKYFKHTPQAIEIIFTVIAIQITTSLVIWPLNPVSLPVTLISNLLLAPLVALVIVPPTVGLTILAALQLSEISWIQPLIHCLIEIADFALSFFRSSVSWMSSLAPNVPDCLFRPFSRAAYQYTTLIIFTFWLLPCAGYFTRRFTQGLVKWVTGQALQAPRSKRPRS